MTGARRVTVVGVDCAAASERTGFAVAAYDDGTLDVSECWTGTKGRTADEQALALLPFLDGSPSSLIALDSPLGWPAALGRHLDRHEAGRPLAADAETLFRRQTDGVVRTRIGKNPLEVGADRIARTARAALALIGALESRVGERFGPTNAGTNVPGGHSRTRAPCLRSSWNQEGLCPGPRSTCRG